MAFIAFTWDMEYINGMGWDERGNGEVGRLSTVILLSRYRFGNGEGDEVRDE
jgi:hypothetical protein